jgi:hypothetical protein
MSACAFEFSSRAVGREARTIQREQEAIEDNFLRAVHMGAPLRAAYDSIQRVLSEHREPNWDGYGAVPVSEIAAAHALRFLKLLPTGTRPPDVNVDPDGEISLEWFRDRHCVFSVSVSARGELNYAGLFGVNPTHGRESHFEDELPFYIRAGLSRVGAARG